ncbi:hypothetical protein [Xanthomonas euvesicatoria]|uniref:hypothetical protein n=1 Tax=Xanthomonas euvesicatoria TaxID=456327 RepID=UPI002406D1DE|nr:hypothetical protein [Xanthomonas euvesicatoria]
MNEKLLAQARIDPVPDLFIEPALMRARPELGDEKAVVVIELGEQVTTELIGSSSAVDPPDSL